MISEVTARFSTPAQLQQVCHRLDEFIPAVQPPIWTVPVCVLWQLMEFEQKHSAAGFGSATLAVDQAMERTRANIKWLQQNKQEVLHWFTSQTGRRAG